MIKKRFISMLVLLAAVVTGAWAETIDLSTLTADYEAQNGDVLTGTLAANVKITIADGATVTLSGAVINGTNSSSWAGLTLAGDGTIILSGENTVKGFYEDYPGIFVPANKTLTIQGDGSLTASSNGYGAGIGSGYETIASGNITIEGGTINAQGGYDAAGIGGGYHTSCGNISITGGTVTATGGSHAAGIGSGSSCGNITITDGAKVTATAGQSATNSIGASYYGTCGTVTIGGTVYPNGISDSPFTYEGNTTVASTYTVTLKEGTEDADNWTITPAEATTTGVAAGTEVKATYTGTKKVKSVKAVKKAAAEPEPAEPTLADVFTDGAVVGVAVKNTYDTYTVTGTYSGGSYTSYTKSSNDIEEVTMTKDGNNLVVWIKSVMNSECTLTFNTQDNTYTKSFKAGTGAAVWDLSEFVSITVNGTDITSTLTDVTPAAAETTVTWTSSDMLSNFYAYFDGWTYNNTHQGITVTASGDAQGGWSQNGINVNEGSGTITFTSSVGNIKSIVITADNMNEIDEWSAPTGWTANNQWDNPRTLSWSGTASASVNLPLSEGQNISGISTIVFTLE